MTCHYCGANVLPNKDTCCFCARPTPQVAIWGLQPEVVSFIKANAKRPHVHVSAPSVIHRTLKGMGVLKVIRKTERMVSYEWTRYGRAIVQHLAA